MWREKSICVYLSTFTGHKCFCWDTQGDTQKRHFPINDLSRVYDLKFLSFTTLYLIHMYKKVLGAYLNLRIKAALTQVLSVCRALRSSTTKSIFLLLLFTLCRMQVVFSCLPGIFCVCVLAFGWWIERLVRPEPNRFLFWTEMVYWVDFSTCWEAVNMPKSKRLALICYSIPFNLLGDKRSRVCSLSALIHTCGCDVVGAAVPQMEKSSSIWSFGNNVAEGCWRVWPAEWIIEY